MSLYLDLRLRYLEQIGGCKPIIERRHHLPSISGSRKVATPEEKDVWIITGIFMDVEDMILSLRSRASRPAQIDCLVMGVT
jgi:hypothetical protein